MGTYMFEIAHPNDSHFDLVAMVSPLKGEVTLRPYLNRLLSKDEMPNPVRADDFPI